MSTAARWAGWARGNRNVPGPQRGASLPGVPFMTHLFDGGARIIVEIAWGADLTASADTWSWTDVTTDVFYGGGGRIGITVGAADEASQTQPATCSMRLDNEAGRYSLGQQSPNWPNVRRNAPVRVRVDLGTGAEVVFFGFANGFVPTWGAAGRNAMVNLSASGTLRRLIQRRSPVVSSFQRSTTSAEVTDVVAYWPCEDGEEATSIASGIDGGSPMGFYLGPPEFAASTDFACSDALPRLDGSAWYAPVAPYANTGATQVRALISFPESGSPDSTVLFRFHTTGTSDLWELRYKSGGVLSIRAWGAGVVLFEQDVAFDVDGTRGQFGIQLGEFGGDVPWNIDALYVGEGGSVGFSGVLAGRTVGTVFKVETNTDDAHEDLVLGHITVQNAITDETAQIAALNAHNHELATTRIARLCAENSVSVTIVDNQADGDPDTVACGFQSIDTLVNLLREAEVVDQGILHDGKHAGLTYLTRRTRENAYPFLTLDITEGDLPDPFTAPADDDQRNVNKATASRKNASSFTYEDEDGPLGTEAIGIYDTDITVNNDSDGEIAHYASLLVRMGTVEGYRYPTLELDFTHVPHLLPQWLQARLGGRIDVLELDSVLAQHPAGTISLLLEGYRQEIDQFRWRATANCSPYAPWQVGVFAADTGDTNPLVLRFDTDGSSLAQPVDAGATSLSVATPSGPLWTTLADDFPLEIDLGGIQVTVTAIAGASSPQTFTVDPATVTVARPAGTPVSVITPTPGL